MKRRLTSRFRRPLLFVILAAAAVAIAGCGPSGAAVVTENSVVNGWSIGTEWTCTPKTGCAELIQAATEELAARDPGHLPIARATVHGEGLYPNRDGDLGRIIRSGGGGFLGVVLFEMADGSYRAIGVGRLPPHLNSRPRTYDFGPERRPGRTENGPPAPTPI